MKNNDDDGGEDEVNMCVCVCVVYECMYACMYFTVLRTEPRVLYTAGKHSVTGMMN